MTLDHHGFVSRLVFFSGGVPLISKAAEVRSTRFSALERKRHFCEGWDFYECFCAVSKGFFCRHGNKALDMGYTIDLAHLKEI